jgi:hypothetical protein
VGWDEDSDDESAPSTPQVKHTTSISHKANDSSATIHQSGTVAEANNDHLKAEGRRSHDRHSQPDSDASYDLVSGATSGAPGSPKDDKPKDKKEESDEDDWV